MPAKFSDSDEVVFAFPKLFADLLKKDLRRTFAQASEVFNVFGNDDDSLWYVWLKGHFQFELRDNYTSVIRAIENAMSHLA